MSSDHLVSDMLRAERLSLCAWLEQLEPGDWHVASMCEGWTVKDVVAHLTLGTSESARHFIGGMIRYRGNFDRMNIEHARRQAQRFSERDLVEQLRKAAGSSSTSFGSSVRDSLIDAVVHGQDVAKPTGRVRSTPSERVIVALEHALQSRWYGARERLGHISMRASDADWSRTTGPTDVTGPVTDLLLVATGRSEGLHRIEGSGLPELIRTMGGTTARR